MSENDNYPKELLIVNEEDYEYADVETEEYLARIKWSPEEAEEIYERY